MRACVLWLAVVLYLGSLQTPSSAPGVYVHADTDSVSLAVVRGDSLVGVRVNGEAIEYIYGHVHVTQDSTILTSDQARRLVDRREIQFAGDVQLVDQGDSLTADTLWYDEARKIGRANSRVRLSDGDVVANAPEGEHFVDEKRAVFSSGVQLVDSTVNLEGQTGEYWTREKRAELAGRVQMTSEDMRVWADSLTHLRNTKQSKARGNVLVEQVDGRDTTRISGNWVHHDQDARRSEVAGFPVLLQVRHDSTSVDTLVVTSEYMRLHKPDDDEQQIAAQGGVQVWNAEFAARADSMAYDQSGELQVIEIFGNPVLWVDNAQINGDTIRVRLTDGKLDSLFAIGQAFVAQFDSATGRIHQLKGRSLDAVTEEDSVRKFTVGPNAEALYYYHDQESGPDGALEASGDRVTLRMVGDEAEWIRFSTGILGTRYPEETLPADLALEGLNWMPMQRPGKQALLSGIRWRVPDQTP